MVPKTQLAKFSAAICDLAEGMLTEPGLAKRNTKECCVVSVITCYCFKLGVSSKLCPGLKLTHLFRKYFCNYFIKSVRIHKQSYKVIASLCCV